MRIHNPPVVYGQTGVWPQKISAAGENLTVNVVNRSSIRSSAARDRRMSGCLTIWSTSSSSSSSEGRAGGRRRFVPVFVDADDVPPGAALDNGDVVHFQAVGCRVDGRGLGLALALHGGASEEGSGQNSPDGLQDPETAGSGTPEQPADEFYDVTQQLRSRSS